MRMASQADDCKVRGTEMRCLPCARSSAACGKPVVSSFTIAIFHIFRLLGCTLHLLVGNAQQFLAYRFIQSWGKRDQ